MIRFFQNLYNALPNLTDSNVIMGGDFNYVLDPVLDRQHSQTSTFGNSGTLNNLKQSYNLVDVWRLLHPTTKDFSYFSTVHKSYSRIDFFLMDSKLLQSVVDCMYNNILISDHGLSLDSADMLDKDINLDEIMQVISSFPNNKAPGPDGFNVVFLKKHLALSCHLCSYACSTIQCKPRVYHLPYTKLIFR